MRLLMIGMSHRTAGIELREQVAVTPDALPAWLTQFCRDFSAAGSHLEAAMLSTCNRTELYVARPTHSEPTHEQMIDWLAKQTQTSQDAVRQACVLREQDAAVPHGHAPRTLAVRWGQRGRSGGRVGCERSSRLDWLE